MNNDIHVLSWAGHIVDSGGLSGPSMRCLCGYDTGPCFAWEHAGELLDDHMLDDNIQLED